MASPSLVTTTFRDGAGTGKKGLMVSSLPRKPKKKFPTKDALEFVAKIEKGFPVKQQKSQTQKAKTSARRGVKLLPWETPTAEGRFVGSGDATKRLGIDGVKAMLQSLPLSTASAGKFNRNIDKKDKSEKATKVKKKRSGKGKRSTKVPPVTKSDSAVTRSKRHR